MKPCVLYQGSSVRNPYWHRYIACIVDYGICYGRKKYIWQELIGSNTVSYGLDVLKRDYLGNDPFFQEYRHKILFMLVYYIMKIFLSI